MRKIFLRFHVVPLNRWLIFLLQGWLKSFPFLKITQSLHCNLSRHFLVFLLDSPCGNSGLVVTMCIPTWRLADHVPFIPQHKHWFSVNFFSFTLRKGEDNITFHPMPYPAALIQYGRAFLCNDHNKQRIPC